MVLLLAYIHWRSKLSRMLQVLTSLYRQFFPSRCQPIFFSQRSVSKNHLYWIIPAMMFPWAKLCKKCSKYCFSFRPTRVFFWTTVWIPLFEISVYNFCSTRCSPKLKLAILFPSNQKQIGWYRSDVRLVGIVSILIVMSLQKCLCIPSMEVSLGTFLRKRLTHALIFNLVFCTGKLIGRPSQKFVKK